MRNDRIRNQNRKKCQGPSYLKLLLLSLLNFLAAGAQALIRLEEKGQFIWDLSGRLTDRLRSETSRGGRDKDGGIAEREKKHRERQKTPLRGHEGQQQWDVGIFLALGLPVSQLELPGGEQWSWRVFLKKKGVLRLEES